MANYFSRNNHWGSPSWPTSLLLVRTWLAPDCDAVPFLVLPLISETNFYLIFPPHGSQELPCNCLGGMTWPYIPQRLYVARCLLGS